MKTSKLGTPLLSIERLDARALPARQPIPGAMAELLSGLLDDERVMDLLRGERFAVVRVPAAIRGDRWVQAADGTRLAVKRGAGGRISGIPVLVGGAGTGAAVGVAPVVAGAVAAVWAHQQIESKMSEMRAGLERIALRLDDADHGVILVDVDKAHSVVFPTHHSNAMDAMKLIADDDIDRPALLECLLQECPDVHFLVFR